MLVRKHLDGTLRGNIKLNLCNLSPGRNDLDGARAEHCGARVYLESLLL